MDAIDKKIQELLLVRHLNDREIASELGYKAESTVRRRRQAMGLDPNGIAPNEDQLTVLDVLPPGYTLTKSKPAKIETKKNKYDAKWIKFGLVSDTHFGHVCQQPQAINDMYDYFVAEGITDVIHAGDLTDGQKMRESQDYEILWHGIDKLVENVGAIYPKRKGVTTHLVQGNHDRTLWNKVGFNVVRAICRERDDLNYLGPSVEDLTLNGVHFRINHGKGAPRKNMGGKLKALIDATPSNEQPDVYLLGHFHQYINLYYDNVYALALPCLQGQTCFLKNGGMYPTVGGAILEMRVDKGNLVAFRVQLKILKVREGDY